MDAAPLTFTFSGVGSGSEGFPAGGSTSFTNALVTFVLPTDTNDSTSTSTSGYTGTWTIAGLGTGTFSARVGYQISNTLVLASDLNYPIAVVTDPSLTGASLTSPFGTTLSTSPTVPPGGSSGFTAFTDTNQPITLTLNTMTFSVQASADAPEPGTVALLSAGLGALAVARMRSASRA